MTQTFEVAWFDGFQGFELSGNKASGILRKLDMQSDFLTGDSLSYVRGHHWPWGFQAGWVYDSN